MTNQNIQPQGNKTGLEEVVNNENVAAGNSAAVLKTATQQAMPEVLPLEEYVERFSSRYQKEDSFRRMVHKYMRLHRFRRFKLSLGKKIMPSWYKRRTEELVKNYAYRVRRDLEKAIEVKQAAEELKIAEQELTQKKERTELITEESERADRQYQDSVSREKDALQKAEAKLTAGKEKVREDVETQKAEAVQKTDVTNYIQEKLKQHIAGSGFFVKDSSGNLMFDEKAIATRLEDMFLEEIVDGIEREEGKGFFSKIKQDYGSLITHWDELEDIEELPEVEWTQSAIYSRTKGYRIPTFPYFITGKGEGSRTKVSLDTATALDLSGSMENDNKFKIAQKTCLANSALMRKLNPNNKFFLCYFNDSLHSIDAVKLLRNVAPSGFTRTDLALEWIINRLEGSGPSIGYLITDGYPEMAGGGAVELAVKAAKRFQDYPILLRIFLINPTTESEKIIREIGKAAGNKTKVIPIRHYQLAAGVIKDVSKCIGEMYDIENF